MLYQKILMGEEPYYLSLGDFGEFREHRHADMEFSYCISGGFDIIVDKKLYHIKEGQIILISPMASHEIPPPNEERLVLTTVVGSSFLKKHFGSFSRSSFSSYVMTLDKSKEQHRRLADLLDENVALRRSPMPNGDLLQTGDLYKICAYLLSELSVAQSNAADEKNDLRKVANIERALELIYYYYPKPLTIDDAAKATGYGKSNFCKIFKTIVGESFHSVLNRQRVKSACALLTETDMTVASVAGEVGFSETKTFCRVFKSIIGLTPGAYRRENSIK